MTELIITEKPSSAKKIAGALSGGKAKKHAVGGVPYYELSIDGKKVYVASTVGHIYSLDETEKTDRRKFPVFSIEWKPSADVSKGADYTKKYASVLKKLAKQADEFTVATDYDIEGEVIGYNIIRYIADQKDAHRMKFSALTTKDLVEAYEKKREHIDWPQALAGETRHKLDWFYGINLSRALSSAIKKGGIFKILSTGRVQAPALKIVADKELEIRKFVPTPYWELEASMHKEIDFPAQHKKGRFLEEAEAKAAHEKAKDAKQATVIERSAQKKKVRAPHPFDLTTLQTEAYSLFKIKPAQTLEVAQELYTSGLISYPRTSSQQLPESIGYKNIIGDIAKQPAYKELCESLLKEKSLKPNNGKKSDPAHPAIYPTGNRAALDGWKKKVYDLVVRRFLATFGPEAERETVTVDLDVNGEPFVGKGSTTTIPGWIVYYGSYARFKTEELPMLSKGDIVTVKKVDFHAKETQPPRRYTPASLVKELEKKGLGTKATRSAIIETLYDRNYITGDSIEVTELGLKTNAILSKYFPTIVDEALTRTFEEEMDQIREDRSQQDKVLDKAKDVVVKVIDSFRSKESEVGSELAEALKDQERKDTTLGPCPVCIKEGREGGELAIKRGKYGRFVGCSNYPDCTTTLKIPKTGVVIPTEKTDDEGWPIAVIGKTKRQAQEVSLNPKTVEPKEKHEKEGTECPKCKKGTLVLRTSYYGPFLGCSSYPKCKYTERIDGQDNQGNGGSDEPKMTHPREGETCSKCKKGKLTLKNGRYGPFLACDRYPKCKHIEKEKKGKKAEAAAAK